jgi:hypothetical protein
MAELTRNLRLAASAFSDIGSLPDTAAESSARDHTPGRPSVQRHARPAQSRIFNAIWKCTIAAQKGELMIMREQFVYSLTLSREVTLSCNASSPEKCRKDPMISISTPDVWLEEQGDFHE